MKAWLLDVAGEQEADRAVVQMWCIAGPRRLLIKYLDFKPYFYLVPPLEGGELAHEVVERKLRGQPVKASLIRLPRAEYEGEAEKIAREFDRAAYEHDIRLAHKFLLSLGLRPSSWIEVEVEPSAERNGSDYLVAKSTPVNVEGPPPELKVVAIEAIIRPEKGSPKQERDAVVQVSLASSAGLERFTGKEQEVITSLASRINALDADILVGFKSKFLLPYLAHRARLLGLKLGLGRTGAEPHTSVYGHISVEGRIAIDIKDLAEEIPEIKLDTLEELAEYMGVAQGLEEITDVEWYRLAREDPETASQLCDERANLILRIFNEAKDYIISLSSITGMPADYVLSASVGFRVENYMMYEAIRRGELIPTRPKRFGFEYAGGFVFEPKPGLYHDVAVIDFRSMYPNIMLKHNVSFENLDYNTEDKAPGLDYGFSKNDAFVPSILRKLIEARREVEAIYADEGTAEQKMLEAKQRALKLLANAMYGYLGWPAARWYSVEAAKAIAAWGRHAIASSAERARKLGLEVLYGDTDSLFIKGRKDLIEELLKWIKAEMGLEARVERLYSSLLLTKAKKKYGGLYDGKLEVVGLEAVRGDWCKAARQAQLRVLELVLKGKYEEARQEARRLVEEVKAGTFAMSSLVIWEKVTRPLDEYQTMGAHVKVALEMRAEGWDVTPGFFVGYIITKGKGKVSERAKPYYAVRPDEVDLDYYAEKQVAAACQRILEVLNIGPMGQSLLDYQ
jgi:DNA polymerase I